MIYSFFKSLTLIFISELGDKTQVLALLFASRYSLSQVLAGVTIGCLLNHGLAVLLGTLLSNLISNSILQLFGGIVFILFGILSLKIDEDEDECIKEISPILTVACAFFIGELGDKTQITAITLGATLKYPLCVLLGTVSGMVITSSLGIYVGSKIGNKISSKYVKFLSSIIFMIIGIIKLHENIPSNLKSMHIIVLFYILLFILVFYRLRPYIKLKPTSKLK